MRQAILVGLIGANIQKSLSPAMFEDACAALGIAGHYHLMDLDCCRDAACPTCWRPRARRASPASTSPSPARRRCCRCSTRCARRRARSAPSTPSPSMRRAAPSATTPTAPAFAAASRRRSAASASPADGRAGRRRRGGPRRRLRPLRSRVAAPAGSDRNAKQPPRRLAAAVRPSSLRDRRRPGGGARAVGRPGQRHAGRHGRRFPGLPVSPDAVRREHWLADVIYTPLETELVLGGACPRRRRDGRIGHVRTPGGRDLPPVHRPHAPTSPVCRPPSPPRRRAGGTSAPRPIEFFRRRQWPPGCRS